MINGKYLRRGLGYAVVLLVCLFIGCELFFRVFSKGLEQWHFPLAYQPDSVIGYTYIPNMKTYKKNDAFKNYFSTNSQGFVGPEFSPRKDSGVYRIIFVGASNLCGLETNGPNYYALLLQKKINAAHLKIEVINCGVDGLQGFDFMDVIREKIVHYNPDLVMCDFPGIDMNREKTYRTVYRDYMISYSNDYHTPLGPIKTYIDKNFYDFNSFKFLYDNCYTYRALCRYYTHNNGYFSTLLGKTFLSNADSNKIVSYREKQVRDFYHPLVSVGLTLDESLALLSDVRARLKAVNSRFMIYSTYVMHSSYRGWGADSLVNLLANYHFKYLPLEVVYKEGFSFGKYDGHSSQVGHEAIAEALFNKLIKTDIYKQDP